MRLFVHILLLVITALVIGVATAWASLALWYRLPAPDQVRMLVAGIFALLGLLTIVGLFCRWRSRIMSIFAAMLVAVFIWWSTIIPPADGDWAADVARQVTGSLDGEVLTLTNLRDFDWHSEDGITERWTTRKYDLAALRTLDLFVSYWAGPEMAHVILSFGFEGGEQLAWSVEVKRRKDGEFSPIADLFKSNPLVIVAADERDVVGVRSNIRREDVQLYRLSTPRDVIRSILLEYVSDANSLSRSPEFYNSITTNCTTTVFKMIQTVRSNIPFDWRLIVNGYLPEYIYERGVLDTRLTMNQLRELSHIDKRAQAAGLTKGFSHLIRVDVPSPVQQPSSAE